MLSFFAVLLAIVLASCASTETSRPASRTGSGTRTGLKASVSAELIPPSHCRIMATIIRIDSSLISSDTSNPCSRLPCTATLRIDSVLGYGSGFDRAFAAGDSTLATFAFTLAPTAGSYPATKESLPGLTTGSRFIADLEGGGAAPGTTQSGQQYIIYGYQKVTTSPDHK